MDFAPVDSLCDSCNHCQSPSPIDRRKLTLVAVRIRLYHALLHHRLGWDSKRSLRCSSKLFIFYSNHLLGNGLLLPLCCDSYLWLCSKGEAYAQPMASTSPGSPQSLLHDNCHVALPGHKYASDSCLGIRCSQWI
jgi:hypothetical protein